MENTRVAARAVQSAGLFLQTANIFRSMLKIFHRIAGEYVCALMNAFSRMAMLMLWPNLERNSRAIFKPIIPPPIIQLKYHGSNQNDSMINIDVI
jgi:hypothetical protein